MPVIMASNPEMQAWETTMGSFCIPSSPVIFSALVVNPVRSSGAASGSFSIRPIFPLVVERIKPVRGSAGATGWVFSASLTEAKTMLAKWDHDEDEFPNRHLSATINSLKCLFRGGKKYYLPPQILFS